MSIGTIIARRLSLLPIVLLGISFYVFLVLEFSPVDPRFAALGLYASPEQRTEFAASNHLDDPVFVRYGRFVSDLAHGNLGVSLVDGRQVSDMIREALPITLGLAGTALVIAAIFALLLGTTAAYLSGTWWDAFVRVISSLGVSLPTFWLALVLIYVFAVQLAWLPAGTWIAPGDDVVGWAKTTILPAASLAIPVCGFLTRVVRSSVLDELGRDYVRTARGAGLPERTVLGRNVLRNSLSAPMTVVALQAGYLLSGAVLVEVVFNIPGLGLLMYQAVGQGDIGVILGVALVAAVIFVLLNLLVDIGYVILNPRERGS
jgi:peptide/nickel transport system permease protein